MSVLLYWTHCLPQTYLERKPRACQDLVRQVQETKRKGSTVEKPSCFAEILLNDTLPVLSHKWPDMHDWTQDTRQNVSRYVSVNICTIVVPEATRKCGGSEYLGVKILGEICQEFQWQKRGDCSSWNLKLMHHMFNSSYVDDNSILAALKLCSFLLFFLKRLFITACSFRDWKRLEWESVRSKIKTYKLNALA